jgi:hypothetical protein
MDECVKLVVEQQDDVIMAVIQSGEYVRLLHMMDDGYVVSGKVLEILRCLKKTVLLDIVARFENPEIAFSPSASAFVQAYRGEENYQKILAARKAAAEKAKEAKHKVLMSRLKVLYHQNGKVSLEVWNFAKANGLVDDLVQMVGLERIYRGIKSVDLPESLFSDGFLVEHEDCNALKARYYSRKFTGRYIGVDTDAMIATIIACYPHGAELLLKANDEELDMELVKSRQFKVFLQSNANNRYKRLFTTVQRYRNSLPRFKRQPWYLPLEDYVEWYKFNRVEADKWIRKERGLIFWLAVKLHADM